jgi:dihydrodipicolinate synthase/N-acetylneuraminate lyase
MRTDRLFKRRELLAIAAGGFVAARSARATPDPDEFRRRLTGPILSVPTVYTEDFRVDSEGLRKIVDTGVSAGSHVIALTAGNGQYDRLTYEEIKQLTRTVAQATAGRGLMIAATGPWWTGQAVDYARFAASVGADAVQVFLPPYGDEDMLFEHFRQIAAATKLSIVLHGQTPLPLLKRLMTIESIVAYKEEYPPAYSVEVFSLYGKRLNIFAGGQKSRYLMFQPYGMQAYYSTFSTFAPEIPRRFWSACEKKDFEAAREIVVRYDVPFFAAWSHPFWRATMERFGVAKRYIRPPDRSFTERQLLDLKDFYRKLGIG